VYCPEVGVIYQLRQLGVEVMLGSFTATLPQIMAVPLILHGGGQPGKLGGRPPGALLGEPRCGDVLIGWHGSHTLWNTSLYQ
jgi:hypothetical protein